MKFEDFSKLISKIANLPLPGQESHYKMAPLQRLKELETINIPQRNPKKAAVISLFYPDADRNARLLLILRKTYSGVHSNQVGFPGGKVEKNDLDLMETALRETHEEVGVDPSKITIVKSLSEVYVPPSNFIVQPYLGVINSFPVFFPADDEVEEIIEVLLSDLIDEKAVFYKTLSTSYAKNIEVPAFSLNGYTVWGATAMMLSEVKELLKAAM